MSTFLYLMINGIIMLTERKFILYENSIWISRTHITTQSYKKFSIQSCVCVLCHAQTHAHTYIHLPDVYRHHPFHEIHIVFLCCETRRK